MQTGGESFFQLALRMSNLHKSYFLELYPPNQQRLAELRSEAEDSLRAQQEIEAKDAMSFEQYLHTYLAD
jgi:glutamate--cysteine ligase